MTEKENTASNSDQNRTHNESPSEGDLAPEPETQRQHGQTAAEGDDADNQ